MPIQKGVSAFYVDPKGAVSPVLTVAEEKDGSIAIKRGGVSTTIQVRSIDVFITEAAAKRAASIRVNGSASAPGTVSYVRSP